jgi:ribosomal protein S20
MAPIFLGKTGGTVQVPYESKLSVSLEGGGFTPHLTGEAAPDGAKFHALGHESWQASGLVRQSGALRVGRLFSQLGAWTIEVLPNDPPAVNWSGVPGRAGKSLELALPWHVTQRWGVAALHASLVPEGHPDLPPLALPVPLPGTPKDAAGIMRTDLSPNPLAGVKMDGRLVARDVSGQTSTSAPAHFTLPARVFKNGLARAIIEVRRRLALQEERPDEAAADLDALAQGPKTAGGDLTGHSGLFLNLVAAAAQLREDPSAASVADAQARLWIVALTLDGALPEPSQVALDRAREQLRDALEKHAQGAQNDPDIRRLMQKLAQAEAQRLADIARKAVKEGKAAPFPPHTQFTMPMLDRLMREMAQALQHGDTKTAQQKLAQIEKLLDQMQTAKVLTPKQAQEAEEANKQAQRQQGAVQDMVQREGKLMDNGQHRAPRPSALPPQFNPDGAEPPPDPDQLEANEESRGADIRTQRALSRALDATKGAFKASGGRVPKGFDDASKDMGDAVQALMDGQETPARQAEARAIADLQKGGKSMSQQMADNTQMAIVPGTGKPGEGGEAFGMEPGGQEDGSTFDPLGRQFRQGTGGKAADDGSVQVPDKMEEGRSRAIQEELRRREADKARKRDELDYIDRLLKPF